jgi:hypothetical protein
LRPKQVFISISPPIAVGWLKYHARNSLHMLYK